MKRDPASVTTPALIARLLAADAYPHPVQDPTCVETHISWVLLTGAYAYKIKKPVSLGFLDFSTLPLRYAACLEELRLNKRLAPQLYVDAVPSTFARSTRASRSNTPCACTSSRRPISSTGCSKPGA